MDPPLPVNNEGRHAHAGRMVRSELRVGSTTFLTGTKVGSRGGAAGVRRDPAGYYDRSAALTVSDSRHKVRAFGHTDGRSLLVHPQPPGRRSACGTSFVGVRDILEQARAVPSAVSSAASNEVRTAGTGRSALEAPPEVHEDNAHRRRINSRKATRGARTSVLTVAEPNSRKAGAVLRGHGATSA